MGKRNPLTASERDKTLALLAFLQEFVNLRRRRGSTYTSDDKILWWHELTLLDEEQRSYVDSPLLSPEKGDDGPTDIWLEIKKPRLPDPPEPPQFLKPWIVDYPHCLTSVDRELRLFSELPRVSKNESEERDLFSENSEDAQEPDRLEDHPEVTAAFQKYLPQWLKWREKYQKWAPVQELYSRLDIMRRQAERDDETYELVMAFGLLEGEFEKQRFARHLFVAPAEIHLEASRGKIRVCPAGEFESFKLDLSMLRPDLRPDFSSTPLAEKLEELDDDLRQSAVIQELLNLVGNHISANTEIDPLAFRSSETSNGRLTLCFAPAVVLRQRMATGYDETVGQLLRVFREGQAKETAPWRRLIAEGDKEDGVAVEDSGGAVSGKKADSRVTLPEDTTIYFPLPFNDEQLRIARRIQEQPCVLVKGPPGTGKSQTIANLICHLLARGDRLLITAESAKALTVLRDMLPEDLRDLCVIALGNSRQQLELMEQSVYRIIARAEAWNDEAKSREITELGEKLRACQDEIAKLQKELVETRKAETTQVQSLPPPYRGTAVQIIEKVKCRKKRYAWLPDKSPQGDFPLSDDELRFFTNWHTSLTADRQRELAWAGESVPLPDVEQVKALLSKQAELQEQLASGELPNDTKKELALKDKGVEELQTLLEALAELAEVIRAARIVLGETLARVIDDLLSGRKHDWLQLMRSWEGCLNELNQRKAFLEATEVTFPQETPVEELLALAKRRAEYFRRGGKRRRFWFFTPKIITETDRVDFCQVNGKRPETLQDLETLILYLELRQKIAACFHSWPDEVVIPQGNLFPVALKLRDFKRQVTELYRCFERNLRPLAVLPIRDWPAFLLEGDLEQWQGAVQRNLIRRELTEVEKQLQEIAAESETRRFQTNNPALAKCCEALKKKDLSLLSEAIEEQASRQKLHEEHQRYLRLRKKLEQAYPKLKIWLKETEGQSTARGQLKNLKKAWHWAQARGWAERITQPGRYAMLKSNLEQAQNEERDILRQLASRKAWQCFMHRLDDRTRQNLQAWTKMIKRIGRGTGKRAPRMRREARQYLRECIPKMPVWIMPLHRLWDTASGQPGMFDTIIIDEASQASLDSLLLLLLGKRIIVVGDDQQNSPEGHFIELSRIEALIDRHLKETFRFAENYRPDFSLYDHAYRAFGLPITLREHFRCVPDIIRFSNNLCYQNEPLIPLRQALPNALPPLKAVYVPEGHAQGESPKIFNRPEAERIVATIKRCLDDPAYKGKTFGVIVLQGQSQVDLIQRMLIEQIEPKELEERKITCGNSAAFQGDQRDVIFLSMVVAPNYNFRALTSDSEKRRFNVAMSRARDQVWLFHSVRLEDLSTDDLRYRLCQFFYSPEEVPPDGIHVQRETLENAVKNATDRKQAKPPQPFESWFEVDVALLLLRQGYRVRSQWEVAGYRIDLVVEGNARRLAIECDGDSWHGPERFRQDLFRQLQLERAGWTVVRICASEFYAHRKRCLEYVLGKCRELGIDPVIDAAADSEEADQGSAASSGGTALPENPVAERHAARESSEPVDGKSGPCLVNADASPGQSLIVPTEGKMKEVATEPSALTWQEPDPVDDELADRESCERIEESPAGPDKEDNVPIRYHAPPVPLRVPSFNGDKHDPIIEIESLSEKDLSRFFRERFPEEESLWKHLAGWAKQQDLFDPCARKFLFKVGRSFSPYNGWTITTKQRDWASDLLAKAIKAGFLRETGLDWLKKLLRLDF